MAEGKAKKKPAMFKAMPNDVSDWGDRKGFTNADFTRPFRVAGVEVDLDSLPGDDSDEPSSIERMRRADRAKRGPLRK